MERLKGKRQIEQLFVSGRSIGAFPLRLVYIETEIINKVGVSVSKKHFKNAVDRNRIKRQLREVYRLQKHLLKNEEELKFTLFFLYIGKEKLSYSAIETSIKFLINKI